MARGLITFTGLVLSCLFGAASAAPPDPDAQGWNGSGWYVTSGAYPGARSEDTPANISAYILFSGPYPQQDGCLEIYDRLFSPIGACRFLSSKPPAFSGGQ